MSVLDRAALEDSPLADLHAIASELSIDGYRRLRRPQLIDAILDRQGGGEASAKRPRDDDSREDGAETAAEDDDAAAHAAGDAADTAEAKTHSEAEEHADEAPEDDEADAGESAAEDQRSTRKRRGRRGGRARSGARDGSAATSDAETEAAEEVDTEPESGGVKDAEPSGRRADRGRGRAARERLGLPARRPPEPSDDDVYISAAQVKRCELVSGDRVSGPRRAPRRSERFASLVRIDTINDRPAAEVISGARFDDLPAAFADERFALDSDDPTLKAIEAHAPFGKGSRVAIVGGPRAGKTEALRRLAAALAPREDISLSLSLAGVRPEEISEWQSGPVQPGAAVSFAASADAQDHAVELVIDQARRIAARGAHAVVLIDTLDGLHPHAARKALAAARNIVDGGSLTVIATMTAPIGGETTVITLDASARERWPLPGTRPRRERHDPRGAARRRGRRRGDRGARRARSSITDRVNRRGPDAPGREQASRRAQ